MKRMLTIATTVFSLLFLNSFAFGADEEEDVKEPFSWGGFYSHSLMKTSPGVNIGGNSGGSLGTIGRVEVGAFASYEVSRNIDIRGMVSSNIDGETDQGKPRVGYAFGEIHTDDGSTGVRIGRVNHFLGFYNQPRNNPLYRETELPPQSIYRDGFKYLAKSGDGIQAFHQVEFDQNYVLNLEATIAKPMLYPMKDILQGFVIDSSHGNFSRDHSTVRNYTVSLEDRRRNFTVMYNRVELDFMLHGSRQSSLDGRFKSTVNYFGVRKYFDFGDITGEYILVEQDGDGWRKAMSPYPSDRRGKPSGYAVTYRHYFFDQLTGTIGYDEWWCNSKDKDGKILSSVTGGAVPAAATYHKSLNLGMKYRISSDKAVRVEWHRVRGTNMLPAGDNNLMQTDVKSYQVFILNYSMSF